jgi:hypothetical protein
MPYVAIIPFHVLTCKDIPDVAKIFFGCLTGLAQKYGYIFATDEQLSDMMGESKSNIKRWMRQLEQLGFIHRERKNEPIRKDGRFKWVKRRKVFINAAFAREKTAEQQSPEEDQEYDEGGEMPPDPIPEEPVDQQAEQPAIEPSEQPDETAKNSDSERAKNGPFNGRAKNGPFNGRAKNGPYNKDTLIGHKEQTTGSEVVVSSCLEKLKITASLRKKLIETYDLETLELLVARVLRWKTRRSDGAAVQHILANFDSWEDNLTTDERKERHVELLEKLKPYDTQKIGQTNICVGNTYVEFSCGVSSKRYEIGSEGFIDKVKEMLAYLKIEV